LKVFTATEFNKIFSVYQPDEAARSRKFYFKYIFFSNKLEEAAISCLFRSEFFWDFMQCKIAVPFGTTCLSPVQVSRNVGKKIPLYAT